MQPTRSWIASLPALVATGLISACGGTDSNPPPATVGASADDNQAATAGGTVPVVPRP